jgi:multicomponent Na+:H+ antiporter subunit G
MTLRETSVVVLAVLGVISMLVSALGLLRLPNVLTRMHAASNTSTVGISCLLLSTGVYFWDHNQFFRSLLLIVLIFVTAPIATSAMARAAYRTSSARQLHLLRDEMGDKTVSTKHQPSSQP